MMTKGVSELVETIICVTKTTRQTSSAKLKGTCATFWCKNFCFFFVLLSACNDKEAFILYAPINLSFHSGQLDELNWGGPDIFTAESETRNECEKKQKISSCRIPKAT
jgi:hypothetical protein